MNRGVSCSLRACVAAAIGLSVAGTVISGAAAPGAAAPGGVAPDIQSNVIVIMRDQSLEVGRHAMLVPTTLNASQSAVIAHLQQSGPHKITSFATINAFATRVTGAEAADLASQPFVQAVVPDRVVRMPKRVEPALVAVAPGAVAPGAAAPGAAATLNSATDASSALCGTLEPEALQLTNTAFANASTPQAQALLDGNGKPITGAGVKVAYIADGLDPTIAGFVRSDGSPVFVDYKDFTGDPAGTPTSGAEAFGDASSIAAQDMPNGKLLTFDISKFVNSAHKLPAPCEIHIRGMAPGASLVGINVISSLGYTTNSTLVQAIEYAVTHGVDVLNESLGVYDFPDNDNNPIALANMAAVKAGVTVTVSSGDAGSMDTIASPATVAGVIAVGATTSFRSYAQTGYGAQALAHGYVSGNISALSSGGFSESNARTIDVVAPGDLGWALCSKNTALFVDCTDYETAPQPSPIQNFGGTSQAAPLTAGAAALVIQAYRSTHGGADPAPALVKHILMSTATDLGAPTSEQGAGLVNSLAAVKLALSIADDNGKPKSRGNELFIATSSIGVIAEPNTRETQAFKITNTGSAPRLVAPALQKLGAPVAGASTGLTLNPAVDPTLPNPSGVPRSYVTHKFTVPAGVEHLDAAIAWQVSLISNATPIVYLSLLDPAGRQVAYSIPQGLASGYGHVDVVKPAPGSWTAVVYTRPSGTGTYSGPVQFVWAARNFENVGSVHPAKATLAPGASETFTIDFFTPMESGDSAAGVRFQEAGSSAHELPVTMRTLIPMGPNGGTFSGALTGGNGRPGAGPTQTYEFDVPAGIENMSVVLPISDNNYLLEGVLVDPEGMQQSVQVNLDPFGAPQYALQHFRKNPLAGRWKFLLIQDLYSAGDQTTLPFTGRIGFNQLQITSSGLPNDPHIRVSASGQPITATIQVINTGAVTEAFFADARLTSLATTPMTAQPCAAVATLPGACGLFFVPPETRIVQFAASSTVPIQMDAYNAVGVDLGTFSPDITAQKTGTDSVQASLSASQIPYGPWIAAPALIGPFGASGAPTKPVAISAYARMEPFDSTVSADSGDVWADLSLGTATFNPLLLPSGGTGTISLTITPNPSRVGTIVSGYVYVDTYSPYTGSGDELMRIPFIYSLVP